MAGNIKFSPEQGREMANEIDRSKCEIEDTISRLTGLINGELCANWEGAASEKYEEQYNQLKEQVMNKFVTMLEELTQQLNSIVETMEAADQEIADQIKMV